MKLRWLPDWKDKRSYPNVSGTPSLQWAWEFLRRNYQYQQLWDQLIGPSHNATKFDDAWKTFQRVRRGPGVRHRIPLTKNPFQPFKEQFHIATYPPPPWEQQAKLYFDSEFIVYQLGANPAAKVHGFLNQNQIVVWFDLTWPLGAQLENAKKIVTEAATRAKKSPKLLRQRAEHYSNYLRVLDAKTSGASYRQILNVLYSGRSSTYPDYNAKQTLRDDLKAAERLRDHDFWLIAATGKK